MKYINYSEDWGYFDLIILKNGELLKGTANTTSIEYWDGKLNRSLMSRGLIYMYWLDKRFNLDDVWYILCTHYYPWVSDIKEANNRILLERARKVDLIIDRQLEHLKIHKDLMNFWQYDCRFNYY